MNNDKNSSMFFGLVATFHSAAMQQMGKIKNVMTDKIERKLEQAQVSIDILDMLEVKTKGNLDEKEAHLLKTLLQELKLNYVDEVSKEQKPNEEKKAE
ncbi:MAG: DUF1844 domain-containing protein [Bacteroidota bacterium]